MNTSSYISVPPLFDLAQTLDCGQCFRWQEEKSRYWVGVAGGKTLSLLQTDDEIRFYCSEEDFFHFWKSYFDLDTDYEALRRQLSGFSAALAEAAAYAPGIRILHQEPFEALCSFIISQNNHIPRIKGIIQRLCSLLGSPLPSGLYAFPHPEALAGCTVEDLSPLRAGFRAKYLVDAGKRVASGEIDLEKIARSPVETGRSELQKIMGVGPKVAECTLLYGFHKTQCFPMDVWMKRAMATLLPNWEATEFGYGAGLAQQYLFHYSRMHPELFKAPPAKAG